MIAILGGGLAGLAVGRRLKEKGVPFILLEKLPAVGGLCRTERRGGFSWDLGPHAFYSKDPQAMAYFTELPLEYHRHKRDVRICHHGPGKRIYEVGYPFENGLCDLPPAHKLECAAGYCWASWTKGPGEFRNLEHWIREGLGRGISRFFMTPYNGKIWNLPLSRISMDLVSRKIEPERPWAVIRNSFSGGSVGRAYQANFIYPVEGAGRVPEAVASSFRENIRTGFQVRRLAPSGKGWKILPESGAPVQADAVVSTIPLPELIFALGDPALEALRKEFAFNETWFVAVGLKPGRDFNRFGTCQWVFFAGPEVFYRLDLMHNFSLSRPRALVAEITRKGSVSSAAPDALVSAVLRDIRSIGMLLDEADVEFAQARLEKYTYPIPSLGLSEALAKVEERLKPERIRLVGRSGRWEYLNTDGVFRRADDFIRDGLAELIENA
ncbi:MAG: FAD-dependent oxidoreductase [Elusimicrobia bacterium]|nr:FAD-dependent oxidoreductase [Elusimicrobiota bacterium]